MMKREASWQPWAGAEGVGTLTGVGSHAQVQTDARRSVQARWEVELGSSHKSQGPEKAQLQIRRGEKYLSIGTGR